MSFFHRQILLFMIAFISATVCYANNLQINNLQVIGNNKISFRVSWENSWELENIAAPYNHDAAWIFVKYRAANGTWQHLDLDRKSVV